MLRRAATTLSGHAAAWLRRLPRRPATPPPGQLLLGGSHHPRAQLQHRRGLPDLGGARGYRRMARRLPPARPDGYSTSEGEADEDPDARDWEEAPESVEEDGDDSEEVEGYMFDFSKIPDGEGNGEEEGADEGRKQ